MHLEILEVLDRFGCSGGTVVRCFAGLTEGMGILTTSLVEVGSKLPPLVQFTEKAVNGAEVVPTSRRMAGERLSRVQEVQAVAPDPLI